MDDEGVAILEGFVIHPHQLCTEPLWLVPNEQWIENARVDSLKDLVLWIQAPLR